MDPNPGFLKLELAVRGVRLDASARADEELFGTRGGNQPAPHSVDLLLPEDLWVTAPIEEEFAARSPFTLVADGDVFALVREQQRIEVRVSPQPSFYALKTSRGTPMSQLATVHGSFVAIHAGAECGFALGGVPCRFCETGVVPAPAPALEIADVVEVVRAAFAEGAAEFVYFNTGYVDSEDGGIDSLEASIRAVKRHFDTLIAVQMHPPRANRWIDRTYAMGVDALSYNLEIHDPEALERRCPGRVRHIGRARYYEALRYAATIFPSGTVWSDLVVGLESPESTMRGIDTLAAMNVLPVLSVWRPSSEEELRDHPLSTPEAVAPIFAHLFHSTRNARINMGWVRDLSFAVTPLEARFFAGDEARMAVVMQQFYRSRLGTMTTRNLARLRRRLRVRRVSDSFDSSHL